MKTFTPEQIQQHALSDAFQRASRLSEQLRQAERRLGANINRSKRNPHPVWTGVIVEAKAEVIRLRAELAAARRAYEELREALPLIERAA